MERMPRFRIVSVLLHQTYSVKDGPVDLLPEGFVVHAEACDEFGEIVIKIWRFKEAA